ncbi:MAG: PEP-CTERM sorting domain-containing protein [Myxococcota bacterium]|nr:PEP-CTERM sorting domain-containing protein [Myxococcota bacterium]
MRSRCNPSKAAALIVGLLLAIQATTVSADTLLIDFNDSGTAGFGWNSFSSGDYDTTQPLIWDDGTPSGISLQLPNLQDSANSGWNNANPLPSWAPASVADDYAYFNWFVDEFTQAVQFVFTGLDPTATYTLDIIASRNLDRNQDFTLSHGGGVEFYANWNTRTDGWLAASVLTIGDLTPGAASEIAMDVQRAGVSGAFNAFRLTSIPALTTSTVPEPATFALTSLGLLVAAARGRRRGR